MASAYQDPKSYKFDITLNIQVTDRRSCRPVSSTSDGI